MVQQYDNSTFLIPRELCVIATMLPDVAAIHFLKLLTWIDRNHDLVSSDWIRWSVQLWDRYKQEAKDCNNRYSTASSFAELYNLFNTIHQRLDEKEIEALLRTEEIIDELIQHMICLRPFKKAPAFPK